MNVLIRLCLLLAVTLIPFLGVSQSPYTLTIESFPSTQEGLTSYRFYVGLQEAEDACFSVFGNQELPMWFSMSEAIYNSPYNSSWSASGLNSAFVSIFPEMVDDSYATIGLTGPAVEADDLASDPGLIDGDGVGAFFQNTDGNLLGFYTPSYTGSGWYAASTSSNAIAGPELRVLIMQVTSGGTPSGSLNYRIQKPGQLNQVYVQTEFDGVGTFQPNINGEEGCMDVAACNYNPNAVFSLTTECAYPGSFCYYGVPGEIYFGTYNEACYCIAENENGCTYPTAINYNPYSVTDDGTCVFGHPCGPGTVWDEELGLCVVAMPSDSNFDGCVQLEDLLAMLVSFGNCD